MKSLHLLKCHASETNRTLNSKNNSSHEATKIGCCKDQFILGNLIFLDNVRS